MRRLLLYILYGTPACRAMWALEERCEAAGVNVVDAMIEAGVYVRQAELNPAIVTKRLAAVGKLRRHFPRMTEETAHTLVRIATEGVRGDV